jgi:RNA polymerase sigma-B factor
MIIVAHLLRRRHRPSRLAALTAEQARTLESLDAAIDLDDSGYASTGDLIGNNDEEYERVEARETVERLTSILDARAREVLRLRHENDLHQAEIAARLGLTQVQVSRILRASYERLAAYCSATAPSSPCDSQSTLIAVTNES